MFNPVMRKHETHRLVYSTSIGFRILFILTAVLVVASVASVGKGSFWGQVNFVALTIIGICLFAALYLERWVFDKKANVFERNVGVVFFHSRRRYPLDVLQKVVLEEPGVKYGERPKMSRWLTRRTAVLSVVDRAGNEYGLDMVKGGSVREARKSAQLLSDFCGIPLEDHLSEGVE